MTRVRVRSRLEGGFRLPGLDLARGLAVIGMLAAHLMTIEPLDAQRPETWIDVANGRSSILFALAAGASIALVSGGATPVTGERLARVRGRLAVRAGLLWILGAALVLTGVPVFVILPAYAVLFLCALPLLSLPPRALWTIAAAAALVLPWLHPALDDVATLAGPDVRALLGWHYPFTVWVVFIVAGLAAGRSDLRLPRTQLWLVVGGFAIAAVGYSAALATAPGGGSWWARVWTAEAHSSGLLEVVGSGGFALGVVGACLLACRTWLTWPLYPLRAVGSMPLSAYVGQLVAWALIAQVVLGDPGDLGGMRALDPFLPFALATLVLCTPWALLVGRGPLEQVVAWISGRVDAHPSGPAGALSPDRLGR